MSAVNLKRGTAMYVPFPWDGKPLPKPVVAVEEKPAADAPPAKKKPMTMEEMMRAADQTLKEDAGP